MIKFSTLFEFTFCLANLGFVIKDIVLNTIDSLTLLNVFGFTLLLTMLVDKAIKHYV